MPLLWVKSSPKGCLTGIWKLSEDSTDLLRQVMLSPEEITEYRRFGSETRRKHWLGYRALLQQINSDNYQISYKQSGQPMLPDPTQHVSVTHSGEYSGVIVCPGRRVGIDIEKINPRIFRVAERFLSSDELEFAGMDIEKLTLCWCAKEALFKIHGDRHYDFRADIRLIGFMPENSGVLYGKLGKNDHGSMYKIHYERIDDYYLTYVVEE